MSRVDPVKAREVVARVERERGIVRAWPHLLAERDPRLLELFHESMMHVLENPHAALPRKYKELIQLCMNALTQYETGFRVHVHSALKHGATEQEIFEALQVVGLLNQHGLTAMLQPFAEELEKHRKQAT